MPLRTTSTQASSSSLVTSQENVQWQVTAEFHRLNVLLMRVDDNEMRQVAIAMKVATATLSDAKIEAHLGE